MITRYAIIAGLIAGVGLALVYISLFRLGSDSHAIAAGATNGAAVLHAYVQHTFGTLGSSFLAVLISLACLVTAVGLTCACAEYFSRVLPLSYKTLVIMLAVFSLLVSNLGLTKLIQFSIPVLTAIYPPCIALVALSFCKDFWHEQGRIVGTGHAGRVPDRCGGCGEGVCAGCVPAGCAGSSAIERARPGLADPVVDHAVRRVRGGSHAGQAQRSAGLTV